ncbi:hypothetical protein [Streptomyces sp. NPDC058665]|uniref:hypothetical protein n=1 Tax=Streptomyces sp. NPDC058665 TaxID=3346586 RepID=UPI003660EFF3
MRIPPAKLKDLEPGGPPPVVRNVVDLEESRTLRSVAYVERQLPSGGLPAYLAARKTGARSFILWGDENRGGVVATVVTLSARDGVATYQVLGAGGEVIGTVVREKALRGRGIRTRWTVTQPGLPEAVGYKGRIFWWLVCWPLSPLLPFLFLGALFNNGDIPRAPRRIRWRAGGRLLLDYRPFRERLELSAPELDWRLGAALVALLHSYDGWLRTPWDARKV